MQILLWDWAAWTQYTYTSGSDRDWKAQRRGQICAALATTLSMHMNRGDVPNNRHSPEPVLCTGWVVRTRLKTTCLIQGSKPAQLNSHPHTKE